MSPQRNKGTDWNWGTLLWRSHTGQGPAGEFPHGHLESNNSRSMVRELIVSPWGSSWRWEEKGSFSPGLLCLQLYSLKFWHCEILGRKWRPHSGHENPMSPLHSVLCPLAPLLTGWSRLLPFFSNSLAVCLGSLPPTGALHALIDPLGSASYFDLLPGITKFSPFGLTQATESNPPPRTPTGTAALADL